MNNTNKRRQALINTLLDTPKVAERKGWDLYYDKELDNLYLSPQVIPDGSVLENINDEIAVYVTPNLDIAGVFIEYFSKNFIKHKKKYKKVPDLFKKGDQIIKEIDERKRDKAELYKDALITEVLKSIPR